MRKRSKRYKQDFQKAGDKPVALPAAVEKIKSFDSAKFDQTIECVLCLGIDPKQSDQGVRGSVSLPHGIGKSKRVIAFCEDSQVEAAKKAGAVEAGCDELVEKVNGGWTDFDITLASPKVMNKVGKLGRILGPQGKMPSPKNGTITDDITGAVKDFSAGKVEYRNDSGGNVHAVVGKQSFDKQHLVDNISAFIAHIQKKKPLSSKGVFLRKVVISASMSPGVQVSV